MITNATNKSFTISLTANDGNASGNVQGTATVTSGHKALMNTSTNGNRCVIEFERLSNNALKVTEIDCRAERNEGTNYSGTLKKQ